MAHKLAYADLYFGKSDSKNEANESPEEFVRSFVDLDGVVERVLSGEKFLILGPKGTGKSALAWYLASAEQLYSHVALVKDASTLPLAEVPRIKTGQPPGPGRAVVAWKFLLLCNYLEVVLRDQASSLNNDPEVIRIAGLLRDYGFMSDDSGRALTKASQTTITIRVPWMGDVYKREAKDQLNIYNLLPHLETWACNASSPNRHLLLLDGLDSILLNDSKYDESLASLVQAGYQINQKFAEQGANGSIVLLLRNDVFNRIALSLPDSQKMRDDLSFDLDWRIMSGPSGVNSPLMRLVEAKAGRALGRETVDVLGYFPEVITVGRRTSARRFPTFQYLLNMTRHTPRDLLRIFEEVRKVEASGNFRSSHDALSLEVIREGVVQYSTKYFVGAIMNEFAGTEGGAKSAEVAMRALKGLNRQTFNRSQFAQELEEAGGSPEDVGRLLTLLFYAGAIGNTSGDPTKRYMQFYHRRDDAEMYLIGNFILHNALIHAWNLRRA